MRSLVRAATLAFLIPACGGGEPARSDGGPGNGGGRLLPLKVGVKWTYRVTDVATGIMHIKTSTVEALEDVGGLKAGVMAFRIRTEKPGDQTVSWQEDRGTLIARHREQSFVGSTMNLEEWWEPYKLRVDESADHTADGARWTESYTETQMPPPAVGPATTTRMDNWTVLATAENVTVPAGTFSAVKVSRMGTGASAASNKTYWFTPGVGKVKETGGQTEELADYKIP